MKWRGRVVVPLTAIGVLITATLVHLDGAGARSAPTPEVAARPNIIVVMADDMRQDEIRTMPHLRSLVVDRGVEFMNSFSPYPLCCPARASFLTGQFAHNHEVLSNAAPFGFASFDDSFTVATALQQVGYNTAMLGKYLNNYGNAPSRVTGKSSLHYVPKGWTRWQGSLTYNRAAGVTGDTYNYMHTTYNVNGRTVDTRGYQTNVLGRAGRQVVGDFSKSSKPFFVWLSFIAPHVGSPRESDDPKGLKTPARPESVRGDFDRRITKAPGLSRTGESEKDASDKPAAIRREREPGARMAKKIRAVARQRAEALSVLDGQIAKLVQTLRQTGEWSNTVLMFTSDNGFFLGEHRKPQGKVLNYEPALRVPFALAGPGIPVGERRYDPISTMDLTATITSLAGASTLMAARHEPDGASRLGVIRNGDLGWRHPQLTESVLGDLTDRSKAPGFGVRNQIGIRTARYQYTRNANDRTELYDLLKDPNELSNVSGSAAYAAVEGQLAALWDDLKDCRGRACRPTLPDELAVTAAQNRDLTRAQFDGVKQRTGRSWR